MMKLLLIVTLASAAFARVVVKRQVPTGLKSEATSRILKLESEVNPDGTYKWAYDTENGITAEETGQQIKGAGGGTGEESGGTVAQGSYQYTNPEGELVQVQYIADENGFQPQGSHIPTPPPIPDSIAKALSYNAAHPSEDVQPNERSSIPAQRPREQASYSPVGSYTLVG